MYETTFPPLEDHGGHAPREDFGNDQGTFGKPAWEGKKDWQDKKPWENKKPWEGKKEWPKKDWKAGGGSGGGFQRKEKPEDSDPTIYLPYAISGDKETPPEILVKVQSLLTQLEGLGWTVRTGTDGPVEELAAKGTSKNELILPWSDFNGYQSKLTWTTERARIIAKRFSPVYDTLPKGVQTIQAKNARLVLGHNMISPSRFLIVWSPDGAECGKQCTNKTGFMKHIISIASAAGVPVFNLGNPATEAKLNDYLQTLSN